MQQQTRIYTCFILLQDLLDLNATPPALMVITETTVHSHAIVKMALPAVQLTDHVTVQQAGKATLVTNHVNAIRTVMDALNPVLVVILPYLVIQWMVLVNVFQDGTGISVLFAVSKVNPVV